MPCTGTLRTNSHKIQRVTRGASAVRGERVLHERVDDDSVRKDDADASSAAAAAAQRKKDKEEARVVHAHFRSSD